ncbi:hypothetical protein ACFLWN_00725 [Chloroflexota bacterium]
MQGITLVLGANELGKTTLVNMLYRMLAGPSDVTALTGTAASGDASLRATTIPLWLKTFFSQRVVDGDIRDISYIGKIRELGFKPKYTLRDIIRDQLNYFLETGREEHYNG